MSTKLRISFIKTNPTVFLSLLIGLTVLLVLLVRQFYSQNPENTTLSQERMVTPGDELYAVQFSSAERGWAVGKFGMILHTGDGGKSWIQQESGTTKPLTSVSFADARHGFAVGGGGTILATHEAGRSWQVRNSGTRQHLLEVHALSVTSAFATGAFGTVLSTNDGGLNWAKHSLPWHKLIPDILRQTGDVEPHLNAVHFANAREGWLAGEFGLVLQTLDGGETWVRQRAGSNLPQITAIKFRDSLNGWAVGQKGTLLKTADGGKSWQQISVEGEPDFYGLSVAEKRAVIVGRDYILKTSNDGVDWLRVDPPAKNIWFSGVAVYGNKALVVGQNGTIHTFPFSERGIVRTKEPAP